MAKESYNKMCLDCEHLGELCNGTTAQFWTGCVWKTATDEEMKKFLHETENNHAGGRENDFAV